MFFVILVNYLLVALALGCAILGTSNILRFSPQSKRELLLKKNGTPIPGELLGRRRRLDGWYVDYAYEYEGTRYTGTRKVAPWSYYAPDPDFTVLCLPDKPEQSLARFKALPLESQITLTSAASIFGLGILFMILAFVCGIIVSKL